MYRFGIVSTASIVPRVIEAIRLTGNEVTAISSRSLQSAKEFAERFNISKYYGTYDELYEDDDIDIIYLPVINTMHYKCAKEALKHHKHVLLEKPFTLTEAEAIELFEIAQNNNCFLMEGVKNVFMPSTEFIKENLSLIGDVKSVRTCQSTNNPFPKDHWMYKSEMGGGAYRGSAAYCFHLLMNVFDCSIEDLNVQFIKSHLSADKYVRFNYKLKNIPVTSIIDMENILDNLLVIEGEKGRIEAKTFWRSHEVNVFKNNEIVNTFKDEGSEFVFEINHVTDCLDKGLITSNVITKERTIKEVSLIEEGYKHGTILK